MIQRIVLSSLMIGLLVLPGQAQSKKSQKKQTSDSSSRYHHLKWRNIGPFRGGRSVAAVGVVQEPHTFYMGSTGGGLWKTEDAGIQWKNISDGFFKTGTVGAIAVAESDPNVVVVGMGEHAARGVMTSMGDGVYISTDAGATWKHSGLESSRHIANIEIHPQNPDLIYVAVQGAQYSPSKERGIYKSQDGGKSWKQVLYKGPHVGAASLSMDKNNPRILYAALWDHQRTPWQMISGGKGSGIYKSTDGGTHWEQLNQGLPEMFGKAGISVSRADSNRVYINLEAEGTQSGVYRSDNGGKNWKQFSKDRITVARSWYYMEVFADPIDANIVYVLNAPALKSIDGGNSFQTLPTPHGDNHHLWIHPHNNQIMINANDGGANVSLNGGKSWSSQQNQPTAQFYRVIADQQVPYHVYGGQQDNSSIGIKSRTYGRSIGWKDWYSVAGCESAFLAFDPLNPGLIYGGCYQGILQRWDRKTGNAKSIKEYPELALGNTPKDFKYRFNWNAPVLTALKDSNTIYHAGNVVFKSTDKGQSWEVISPDLTRNEKEKQVPGGVPFTNEAAGGENYNTLMSLAVSPHSEMELWAGSDDGLLHLTRDGGKKWLNITPKGMKEGIINSIDISDSTPGKAYITLMRYKFMDLKPYVYKTEDYGQKWELITDGIEGKHTFVRVVRADKKVPRLLYAGTETGLYVSTSDGEKWAPLQLNLPVVPINDLFIQDNDLIAATAGRSFWILDDLAPLQQLSAPKEPTVLTPKPSYRIFSGQSKSPLLGQNPLPGVILDYYLPKVHDSLVLRLDILNGNKVIRSYSNQKGDNVRSWAGGPQKKQLLPAKEGYNRFAWDLNKEMLPAVDGVFVYGNYAGSAAAPGSYTARLQVDGKESQAPIHLIADPNIVANAKDYQEQEALLDAIDAQIRDIHSSVTNMREVQKQLAFCLQNIQDNADYQNLYEQGQTLEDALIAWEKKLIQPDQKTFQDVINFNNQLNAEFMHLKGYVDTADPAVTQGALERFDDLKKEWGAALEALQRLITNEIATFNQAYQNLKIPVLNIPE